MSDGEEEGSFEDIIKFAAETQRGIEELRNEPDKTLELKHLFRLRAKWFTLAEKLARLNPGANETQRLILSLLKDSALRELESFEYVLELEKEVKRLKEKYDERDSSS